MKKKANNIFSLNSAFFRLILGLIFILAALPFSKILAATEIVFKNNVVIQGPGTYYFVVSDTTRMTFEVWGGGGRGGGKDSGSGGGGGGGGGAYARKTIDLVEGDRIDIVVGAGGGVGSDINGGISEVKLNNSVFLKAAGGKGVVNNTNVGGAGGAVEDCEGDIIRSGGNGGNVSGSNGGGGGSSGGPAANGENASGSTGGIAPPNGGNGANGRTSAGHGVDGSPPGGGGGGASRPLAAINRRGGNGGPGRLRIMNMCRVYWYKADMPGDILPNSGDPLSVWKDKTEHENHGISSTTATGGYTASASHPKWYDNKINFNPAVEFTDGYYLADRRTVANDMAIYMVFSTTQEDSSGNWWEMPALIGGEVANEQADWGFSHSAGRLFFKSTNSDSLEDNPQTTEAYNTGKPILASGFRKMGDSTYIHVNGTQQASKPAGGISLDQADKVGVGRNPTEPASQFKGFIAEVTALNNMCNATDKAINDTYYAIKYGITLEHDYKRRHAKDSVIYSVATHNHDIAGLGRQDYTLELHQKISSSSNVPLGTLGRLVIATSEDFTGSNVTSPHHKEVKDGQYLIWGHNNEGEGWTNINSELKRQNRVWKVQNTANASGEIVSGTYLQINLDTFDPIPENNKSEIYAILMARNSDFSGELYYVSLTHNPGNLYSAAIDFPEGVSYFTVARMHKNYWTGAVSTGWTDTGNWGAGFIPASDDDVTFATVGNYGTAAVRDMVISDGKNVVVKNLVNASNKNLIIETNASLTVSGVVSISDKTNPDRIQINAAADKPNGSFIINCDAQQASDQKDVYVTVQMCAISQKLSSEQTWFDNIIGSPTFEEPFKTEYTWQFFGVPVQSVRAEPTFNGAAIRQYFENYNGEDNSQYYQKWKNIYNESDLGAFKGYEITQEESHTAYTIQGKLVYCDQDLTMTRKAPAVDGVHYGLGQNIFGNSFTSAIKVDNIIFPEEAEYTVYLYNTGSFVDWGNTTGTNEGNQSAGQYTAIPQNTANYDGQIPSMNGFLVRFLPAHTTYDGGDKTLTIRYSGGVEKNTKPQTAPRRELSWLEVILTGGNSVDRLWLYNQEGTTPGFDNGWDGFKFFGTPNAFIFSETKAGPLQVDTDETIHRKLISFYANDIKNYTLQLVRSHLQDYQNLHLLDLETQQVVAIDRDTVSYNFMAESTGKIVRRFMLVDSAFPEFEEDNQTQLSARLYNRNRLAVNNFTSLPGSLMVFDAGGRLVFQDYMDDNLVSNFLLPLQRGVYLVRMEAGSCRAVEKVIIY